MLIQGWRDTSTDKHQLPLSYSYATLTDEDDEGFLICLISTDLMIKLVSCCKIEYLCS